MEDVVLLSRTAAEGCDSVIRRGMSLLLWAVYRECVNVGCVWMLLSKDISEHLNLSLVNSCVWAEYF